MKEFFLGFVIISGFGLLANFLDRFHDEIEMVSTVLVLVALTIVVCYGVGSCAMSAVEHSHDVVVKPIVKEGKWN